MFTFPLKSTSVHSLQKIKHNKLICEKTRDVFIKCFKHTFMYDRSTSYTYTCHIVKNTHKTFSV